ncbi:MAG: ABC transporter ATP-binding protein [Balneolaceae bacterium]|nr:ABC transporter ATP-binding protein [Balneolaceae bacterium]
MYIIFALTLLTALAEGLGISLLLPLIEAADSATADYDNLAMQAINAVLSFFGASDSISTILIFIGIVFVGKGLLKFAEGGYKGYLESQLMRELKTKMYDAYNSMDYRYFIQRNTGHFINVINGQIQQSIGSFNKFLTFLTQVIMAASYLVFAFFITWNFALMAIGVGAILLILFKTLNVYVTKLSRKTAREASNLNKFLVQTLQAFKYITSTGQNDHLRESVIESVHKLAGYRMRQQIANAFTTAIKEPVSIVFMIGIVAIQVFWLGASIGPIAVALLLFHRGMRATITVQESWQGTMNVIGSLEMVEEEFTATSESVEIDGEVDIGPLSKEIRFESVNFAYDMKEETVIQDLSLTIPVNQTVALVGESGAGKTTLADLLTLMLRPQSGDIYIDGVSGRDIQRLSWRKQIGYVSQETVVFDDTIANNISLWKGDYANDPEMRKRVEEAARKAYADIFIQDLPDGFETVVGDRGVRLSGGQRQRLFIARELFKEPNLLILDEATSALDSESEQYIQEGIDGLKGSLTVVMIAHRFVYNPECGYHLCIRSRKVD